MQKRFYTPAEVADLLNVSSTTVMNRIHRGALPAVRVSERIYRIPVPAFERFVSTTPATDISVEYRDVDDVGALGEPAATRADEPVEV